MHARSLKSSFILVIFAAFFNKFSMGCPKAVVRAATRADPQPPEYEGCFADKRGERDLPIVGGQHEDMNAVLCEKWCRALKTQYIGLQEGMQCWCGNTFGIHGKAEEVECSVRCVGNKEERCGGVLHNSVYKMVD